MSIADLLNSQYSAYRVYEVGLDQITDLLQADLNAHNAQTSEMLALFAEPTTERFGIYGGSAAGEMQEVDEYGRGETQRPPPATGTIGVPLKKFQFAIGWTEDWFRLKTVQDFAQLVTNAQDAHRRRVIREFKSSIYLSGNLTLRDVFVDYVDIPVKRWTNADSAPIPMSINGNTFAGATHTHFINSLILDDTAMTALVSTLEEHELGGGLMVAINIADEVTVRGLTGFKPYLDARIVQPAMTQDVYNGRLNPFDPYNRAIGVYGSAEVWVKPWALANYLFAWAPGAPRKPLRYRQLGDGDMQGLRVAATLSAYPLVAQEMEAYFGLAVYNRIAGAVLNITANGAYTDPTIS